MAVRCQLNRKVFGQTDIGLPDNFRDKTVALFPFDLIFRNFLRRDEWRRNIGIDIPRIFKAFLKSNMADAESDVFA